MAKADGSTGLLGFDESAAIFEHLNQAHQQAQQDPGILRASLDAKMAVPLGPFSRGGHNRIPTKAWDHDFKPNGRLTPFGLLLPQYDLLDLFFTPSKVTADFIVDLLNYCWRFPSPFFMAPIGGIHQGWATVFMKTGAIDGAAFLLE